MLSVRCVSPAGLDELAAALREVTPASRLLAGGTDLVRTMNQDRWCPDLLIDLSAVAGMAGVCRQGDRLYVGAMTTFSELGRDDLVRRHAPCLAEAAATVGSVQTRNMATIGGNVANASPCADSVPVLLALGATVEVMDADGELSERGVGEVVTGDGQNGLRLNEVITGFWAPVLSAGQRDAFVKVGPRTTVAVARLSLAVVVGCAGDGALTEPRVAFGAVGATAFRDPDVEQMLEGRRPDAETAAAFAQACVAAVRRSIPDRPSLPYKEHLAAGVAADAWQRLGLGAS